MGYKNGNPGCCCSCGMRCFTVYQCNVNNGAIPVVGASLVFRSGSLSGPIVASGVTDSNGQVCISYPTAGNYAFSITPPSGSHLAVYNSSTSSYACVNSSVKIAMVPVSNYGCCRGLVVPMANSGTTVTVHDPIYGDHSGTNFFLNSSNVGGTELVYPGCGSCPAFGPYEASDGFGGTVHIPGLSVRYIGSCNYPGSGSNPPIFQMVVEYRDNGTCPAQGANNIRTTYATFLSSAISDSPPMIEFTASSAMPLYCNPTQKILVTW